MEKSNGTTANGQQHTSSAAVATVSYGAPALSNGVGAGKGLPTNDYQVKINIDHNQVNF